MGFNSVFKGLRKVHGPVVEQGIWEKELNRNWGSCI